jgi:NADPH:quinone reductase-like Zn-dependent oxidoreductase
MRAWIRPARGPSATALKLSSTQPTPTVAPDSADLLVRVSYSALQFTGEFSLQTLPALPGAPPLIPEIEFSGVVVAAGSQAPSELREVGARVVASQTIPSLVLFGQGALAEYVKVSAAMAFRLPDNIDLATASGMVGCGSTAIKMARTAAVGHGDRILVNGASSSVGSVLVQICKMNGATVVGTASGRNEELVRSLGVDEVCVSKLGNVGWVMIWLLFCQFVDYTAHSSLPEYLKSKYSEEQFDSILDCAGIQSLYSNSPDYLKPSGLVVNIGIFEGIWTTARHWFSNTWWPTWLGGVPRRYIMFSTPISKDGTTHVARLVEEGKVRILIDSVWKMEDVVKAYARIATKRGRGRVIIKVGEDW